MIGATHLFCIEHVQSKLICTPNYQHYHTMSNGNNFVHRLSKSITQCETKLLCTPIIDNNYVCLYRGLTI